MDLDTRARSAAQGIRRAVEVMEMTTKTEQPRKVERFDQYEDRKDRNRKVGALAVAAAMAVIVAIVAVSSARTDQTQPAENPAISWPISAPGTGGFTVDLTTGKATPLPDSIAQADSNYAVSPDHTKVVYECCASPSLYMANMDGTGIRQITSDRSRATGAQWSPDGSTLVYQQRSLDPNSTALGNLFIYDVRTARSTRITNLDQLTRTGGWWFMFPTFMPTDRGPAILFQMPRGTNPQVWDLWSVPVSGGKPVIVQKNAGWGAIDSNGRLAYATPVSAHTFDGGELMVRNVQHATAPEALVPGPIVRTRWSPDGTRVAYVGKDYVYVLNVADGSTTKIVNGGSAEWFDDNTLVVGP
jgi:WD40 repeat protein